jgi:holo-[acyl-carrier protein] synthase
MPWLNGAVIGLDLLEIDRLEEALARRPSLAERLFTDGERSYAATQGRPARHLAARFCAKEAVSKALQMDVLRPRDIEILGGGDGPPRVALHGEVGARAAALGVEVHISLTHTKSAAAAVAVLR